MTRINILQWLGIVLAAIAGGWTASATAQESGGEAAGTLEKSLVQAIEASEKSVVAIARVHKEQPGEALHYEFRPNAFGVRVPAVPPPQPTDPNFVPNEYGAGVVVDRRGLVLTAYHVLADDSDYYITTASRKVYRAWVKAADPRSDLAVLAVDANDLAPITLGDGSAVRKGQIVVTLGNPYAIARDGQASAGWGIVSNLARKAPPMPDDSDASGKRTLHHFGTLIQTDAKLNVGTSGGALVNLKGEMVGLCVALAAAPGCETAGGYAIPVDATFRRVLEILKQGREVEYGFLGIQPVNLQSQEALAGMQGIRIEQVGRGTPAERYGLRTDDIVTAINDRPIYDSDGLKLEVGKLPVEAVARLNILRNGQPRQLEVTLGKFSVHGKKIVTNREDAWRGLRVDYPTALSEDGTLNFVDNAVVVSEVDEGSAAWHAGLRRGMFISQVEETPIRTPAQFRAALAGRSGAVQFHLAAAEPNAVLTVPGS
jgi:serine protease Do